MKNIFHLSTITAGLLMLGCGNDEAPAPEAGAAAAQSGASAVTPDTNAPQAPAAPAPAPVPQMLVPAPQAWTAKGPLLEVQPKASATPNDFKAVTEQLDAGGDVFVYWNAHQAVKEINNGIGLVEAQFNKLIEIERRDGNRWAAKEFEAMRAVARLARSVVNEGGLAEVKGVGMSSLALEKDLFRNRLYLLRDEEREPGAIWKVLEGNPGTVTTGLSFAPATTVMAHYTRLDLKAATDWTQRALVKSGVPTEFFVEMLGMSPREIQRLYFAGELTAEAKPFVGRWSGVDNAPKDPFTYEIFRRPDGTYVQFFVGEDNESNPGGKVGQVEEGLWKVEGGLFIYSMTHSNGRPVPVEELAIFEEQIKATEANKVSTRESRVIDLSGGRFDDRFEQNFGVPEEAPGPDPGEGPDFEPRDGDDFPREAPVPEEEVFEGPFEFTDTRVEKFKAPEMAKYNGADALKPVERPAIPSPVGGPLEAILKEFGGELGVFLTLDTENSLPFKQGPLALKLPRPGVVLVAKSSPDGTPLAEHVAEFGDLVKRQVIEGQPVFTFQIPKDELPIRMPVEPTLFQLGPHVVFASDLALVKQVMAVYTGKAPGLRGTAEFARLSGGMKLEGQQLQFVSQRAGATTALLKQLLPVMLVKAELPEEAQEFFTSMTKQLLPKDGPSGHLAVLRLDEKGLLFEGRASGHGYRAAVGQSALVPITMAISAALGGQQDDGAKPKVNFATEPRQQIRELTLGLKLHLEDKGVLVNSTKWADIILPEVGQKGVYRIPGAAAGTSSYALNAGLKNTNIADIKPDMVLIFQASGPWNHVGGLAEAKKAAAGGAIWVGFGNGDVRQVPAAGLDRLNWGK